MERWQFPGLVKVLKEYLVKWNVLNFQEFSKSQWRLFVRRMIRKKNFEELIEESRKYKEINTNDYKLEDFQMKDYLKKVSLHDFRVLFRYDFQLLQSIQMNQKSNKRFKENRYRCIDCLSLYRKR